MTRVIEIETERLRMRPFATDHVDELHRLWTDPGVRKYLWDDTVISRDQTAEVIKSSNDSFEAHGFGLWAVYPKDEERLIGFCGFRLFGEAQEIEILYGIEPARWGEGLATEAAQAMIQCGFREHGFEMIYAGADAPNSASFRVMEKCGMKFSKRLLLDGVEAVYYTLAKEEFQPDQSACRLLKADR